MVIYTKGYLTGGLYGSDPEEWDALYRLEGARRRWRRDRAYYQSTNAYSWGVEPWLVTYRHVCPNPAYVEWQAQQAETNRAYQEARQRQREEWAAGRSARAAHWQKMGWEDSRDRARWVVARLVAGDTQAAIARKAKLARGSVGRILGSERRRREKYRGPQGRVFELDNFYPRDAWITYTLEDEPNDLGLDLWLNQPKPILAAK